MQQRLDALLRRLYGPRPEPVDPNQPLSFGEWPSRAGAAASSSAVETSRAGAARASRTADVGRRPQLRREPRRYELTAAERLCPECGIERPEIGVEIDQAVRLQAGRGVRHRAPARQVRLQVLRRPGGDRPQAAATASTRAAGAGTVGPDHRRQISGSHPAASQRATLRAAGRAAAAFDDVRLDGGLRRVVDAAVSTCSSSGCCNRKCCTPTTPRCRCATRPGAAIATAGSGTTSATTTHPGIVFDYTTTHARDGPAAFLKDFKGFLQADAYGAYDGIYTGSNGAILEVGCWAHARNKFKDAYSTDPERVVAAKAWVRNSTTSRMRPRRSSPRRS